MGNRLTSKDAANWTYNQNNELTGNSTTTYQYDQNGNTTQKNSGGNILNFVYDVDNRLIEIKDGSNATIATYSYDPFGRRIKKTVGSATTYYLYSDEGLIGEYDSSGTEIKTYGWKANSTWSTDPVFMKEGTSYYFYHNDHLGTPQKMTSASGAVVWSANYDAFGKATVDASSTITNNLRFPGQYFDAESGLHYNWNRFYDPGTGRYLTTDPFGIEGGINLYSYVTNKPMNAIDPYGLWQYHGNWCGPDRTRRYPKSWDQLTPAEKQDALNNETRVPIDPLDNCCMKHDKCCGDMRDKCKCKPDPESCVREKLNKCDDDFKDCTSKLPPNLKSKAAGFAVGTLQPSMRDAETARQIEMYRNRNLPQTNEPYSNYLLPQFRIFKW